MKYTSDITKHWGWVRSAIIYTLLPFTFLLLFGCNSPSSPDNVTISGTFSIAGSSDNSGIMIAIYPLDTTLTSQSDIYLSASKLGVSLEQNRVFHHSDSSPIATFQSSVSGSFAAEVARGIYNVVVYKTGYGFRYFTNVDAQQNVDLNTLYSDENFELNEEVVYSGVQSGTFIFRSDANTVIGDNTYFMEDSQVTIEPGAIIRIAPEKLLEFRGALRLRGGANNPIRFFADGVTSPQLKTVNQEFYDKIQILDSTIIQDGIIENVVFSGMQSGLRLFSRASVMNCTFLGGQETLMINNINSVGIEHNLFASFTSASTYSVNIGLTNDILFANNILWGSSVGMDVFTSTGLSVENNYFNNSEICAYLHNDVNGVLTHNTFKSDGVAVRSFLSCNTEYYYNDIESYLGLDFGGTYSYGKANSNNFNCSYQAIKYVSYNSGDMDAKQNYYHTTDPALLATLIWDKTDYSVDHNLYDVLNYVIFSPYSQGQISNAGIR